MFILIHHARGAHENLLYFKLNANLNVTFEFEYSKYNAVYSNEGFIVVMSGRLLKKIISK